MPAPTAPLTYSKPMSFNQGGAIGSVSKVERPNLELAVAAQEAGSDKGTWFSAKVSNNTGAELRPQLINLHTANGEHFQAYGEVATAFNFAKNAPENQKLQNLKNSKMQTGALAPGASKTVFFYSSTPIADGFESGTIQFTAGSNNLIIDLPANN